MYAAQGHDTARAIGAALAQTAGSLEDTEAFRKAMLKAEFDSVRGHFAFSASQHPVQDWYGIEVMRKDDGSLDLVTREKLAAALSDPFTADCKLAAVQ